MKALIWIGITLGGLIGGYVGTLIDHGSSLSLLSILLSGLGSIIGIWAAVKLNDYI